MGYFTALDISTSGLTAMNVWMQTISENIANSNTTRTENGQPYKRKEVVLEAKSDNSSFSQYLSQATGNIGSGGGVRVAEIVEDNSPPKIVYDPGNPDADANGYVQMPNVNPVVEMINMIAASRAYEANISSIKATEEMANQAMKI